jgi:hypothetical protein
MSSESVCQVTRNWMEVGSFLHAFSGAVYEVYSISSEYLDTPWYISFHISLSSPQNLKCFRTSFRENQTTHFMSRKRFSKILPFMI